MIYRMSNMKKRDIAETDENNKDEVINNENKKTKIDDSIIKKCMPLKNLSLKASSSFKSPLINRKVSNTCVNEKEIEEKVNTLEMQLKNIESEIENLVNENIKIAELDSIMKKMHDYNDIKDIAQILMGKIADIKYITIKEVHKKYDADLDAD